MGKCKFIQNKLKKNKSSLDKIHFCQQYLTIMIRNIFKSAKTTNYILTQKAVRLNDCFFNFMSQTNDGSETPNNPPQPSAKPKTENSSESKRNFYGQNQNNNNEPFKKRPISPFKKNDGSNNRSNQGDGGNVKSNQGDGRNNNYRNNQGDQQFNNNRSGNKNQASPDKQFQTYKREDNQQQGHQQQQHRQPDNERQHQDYQQTAKHQDYQQTVKPQGNEGQFLSQLNRSEQTKNERSKGANQHSTLMKRIRDFESNKNPSSQDLRSVIETYCACGFYEKVISVFEKLNSSSDKEKISGYEAVINAVLEALIKSPSKKLDKIIEFIKDQFISNNQLKLLYKENIQNFISRACNDQSVSTQDKINALSTLLRFFREQNKSVSSFSFQGIDLSGFQSLFVDSTTSQYKQVADVFSQLLSLAADNAKNKNVQEQIKVQLEILNVKQIFSNLLSLKEYETCKLIVQALSKSDLLHSQQSHQKAGELQKFISYKDLIQFALESKQSTLFWVDVIAKRIDLEQYTAILSSQILKFRMNNQKQEIFSRKELSDFFLDITNYGALSPSQVYTLMEISIYLKEYSFAIELFTNHQKYTNRRRDLFVYEKILNVISTIDLRPTPSKSSKDHALQAFRKIAVEAEQQIGKPISFMPLKIQEIKSHILDQNLESAYSIFNERFLKDSIAIYQAQKIKVFLFLLLESQNDEGEIHSQENFILKFVNGLQQKQLIQLWQDERNDTYLSKQLANKEGTYAEFVKRIEVQKYFSWIKRDMNKGYYNIEERRQNLEGVYMNEYEKYVIDNFEELDPVMTEDNKLKSAVLDGVLKIKKYQEMYSKKEYRKREKLGEKTDDITNSSVHLKHEKEMEDSQIEINKILGRPIDTPVSVPELYKKFDLEDKVNNKYIENYVSDLQNLESYKENIVKMKFLTLNQYKDLIQVFPQLLEKASILARPRLPDETELVLELMTWGTENNQPLAIQLGEVFCDLNGIPVPIALTEKINQSIQPFNDSPQYLNQFQVTKRFVGDVNRERMYFSYTHFSQKPHFIKTVNMLAEDDKYKDEAAYVLQNELSSSRKEKYGIPTEYIMEQLSKA